MGAVVAHHAHLDLGAESLPEGLVLLPVILLEAEQLGLDLLLQVARDHLELAGVLEHLTGDVEGEVLGVHHALDKAEVLGQQIGALVHDEHAGGVELEALLVLPGVEVIGGVGRDIEHGLVLHRALGGHVHHAQGILPVAVLLLIKLVVLLRRDLALGPLPQGDHGVEGLPLVEVLPLGLVVVAGVLGAGLLAGLVHEHDDGVVDVVGVFFDQLGQAVLLQVLVVVVVLGVLLDVEHDVGASALLPAGGEGVPVRAVGGPLPRLVGAVGPGGDGDVVGHHEGGVEAHAELADDVGGVLGQLLLELEGAAAGDGAQVLLQLLLRHADAIVGDGQGAGNLVGGEGNFEVGAVQPHLIVGEGLVGQLVHRVAGVGDQLPQEDLLVGVDGVDHQIQQPLGLGLELFLCHDNASCISNGFVNKER